MNYIITIMYVCQATFNQAEIKSQLGKEDDLASSEMSNLRQPKKTCPYFIIFWLLTRSFSYRINFDTVAYFFPHFFYSDRFSFSFSFFLHGESIVCTTVEVAKHDSLERLSSKYLHQLSFLSSSKSGNYNLILKRN